MSRMQTQVLFVACIVFATLITHSIAQTTKQRRAIIEKGTSWDEALDLLQKYNVHEVEEDTAMGWTPGAPKSSLTGYLCMIEDGVRLRIHYDAKTNVVDSMRLRYEAPFLERRGNYRRFTCTKLELHDDRSYTIQFGSRRESDRRAADKFK